MTKENQYSLAHLTVLGCPPPELTYIAARAGYDFVSFRPMPLGTVGEPEYRMAEDKALMRASKRALAETGMRLLDVELARVLPDITPRKYLPIMEVAAELGGTRVLCSAWVEDKPYIIDFYAELCQLAKEFGLTVDFEFVTWSAVKTLSEALDVLRAADQENCGIMIDTLHFNRSRVALEEIDAIPPEWVHFTHLCDGPAEIPAMDDTEALILTGRGERLYPGEGGIDLAAIINRLPQVPMSIELPHTERAREFGYAEHATRCLEYAKAYFAAHPRSE